MAFIREKKRKIGEKYVSYAYLVKNKWDKKKGSSRQAVSKYLGRIIISKEQDITFREFIKKDIQHYLSINKKETIINDLVKWEIKKSSKEIKYSKKKLWKNNKQIVLKANLGHLCGHTIRKLINFEYFGEDDKKVGRELALLFADAGIKVPQDVFITIFEKIS